MIVHPYPKLDAGNDLFVLEGGTAQLKPIYFATNASFNWFPTTYLDSPLKANPITTPLDDITYTVRLTGIGGCSVTDDIKITVLRAPLIPNAFSPNGDGINDTWEIKYLESYPGATIEVYDRGGRLVFNSINYPKNWDGTTNGKPLPVATYYYIINPKNGRKIMSGSVTILR
jgi:gliding motility-associated-like protein